jgi:hypothetical protein
VKVAVGSQSEQKVVQVEEDPRIQLNPADKEQRLAFLLEVSELQKRADKVQRGVTALRTQTSALEDNWKKPSAPKVSDAARKAAEGLKTKLDALNRRVGMGGFREGDFDPTVYIPPSIPQRLLRLMGDVDGYTSRISEPQTEEFSLLKKLVSDVKTQYQRVQTEDVPTANKTLVSAGAGYIGAGGANP